MSGSSSDNKWYNEWYNKRKEVLLRVATNGTTSDKERQQVTTNDNESSFRLSFLFSNKRGI